MELQTTTTTTYYYSCKRVGPLDRFTATIVGKIIWKWSTKLGVTGLFGTCDTGTWVGFQWTACAQCSHYQLSLLAFLQRVSIACYAKRCTSYRKSVRLSVRLSQSGTVSKRLKLGSWGLHWRIAPRLVSSRLTAARNSKGNLGSEGAEWERGGKSGQFLANKSPNLGNGAR